MSGFRPDESADGSDAERALRSARGAATRVAADRRREPRRESERAEHYAAMSLLAAALAVADGRHERSSAELVQLDDAADAYRRATMPTPEPGTDDYGYAMSDGWVR